MADLQDFIGTDLEVLNSHYGLPSESGRILDGVKLCFARAVEDHVQPIIILEPFGGTVLVLTERNDAHAGSAFDLDESNFDESLWVFGMRTARDQVKAAVLGFDTLNLPAASLFVLDREPDGDLFDLVVADHRSKLPAGSFGMRQHPRSAEMLNVGDRTMALQFQFLLPCFEPIVEFVEMLFGLSDQAIQSRSRQTFDLAIDELRQLEVLSVDQRVQTDLNVPSDASDFLLTSGGFASSPRLQRVFVKESLDRL